ncbi:Hypothetical protein CAP_7963 [Chondromyces apiculatus DSM 436]|uniref:Uncharacterized protein n=1 Tax=Chondromyces apiculatus DSM 436 TaxID=1192034 RepID=A0A017SXE4_9BACT|nr:Hypothetical protein CAP_7963 [Chondromyces apiculatus DSM 436]
MLTQPAIDTHPGSPSRSRAVAHGAHECMPRPLLCPKSEAPPPRIRRPLAHPAHAMLVPPPARPSPGRRRSRPAHDPDARPARGH